MYYIGIDNGTTGTLAVLTETGQMVKHAHTPVKQELNYTKEKKWIHRIDVPAFIEFLKPYADCCCLALERPAINCMLARINTTVLAARAFEATLIALENLKLPTYNVIDSKQWQKVMLPEGVTGREELKKAAVVIAKKYFPAVEKINKDTADSLLIAEWLRRRELGMFKK